MNDLDLRGLPHAFRAHSLTHHSRSAARGLTAGLIACVAFGCGAVTAPAGEEVPTEKPVPLPEPGEGFSSYYSEVTWAFCMDVAASRLDVLPGTRQVGEAGQVRDLEGFFTALGPFCACAAEQSPGRFNALYVKVPSLAAMFGAGAASMKDQMHYPTNFGSFVEEYGDTCMAGYDTAPLVDWLYSDATGELEPDSCKTTSTGALGTRLAGRALLETLFTLEGYNDFFGNPAPASGARHDGCRGAASVQYVCSDARVDAVVEPCSASCGGCEPVVDEVPQDGEIEPVAYEEVLSAPACAGPGSCETGDLPTVSLPMCEGGQSTVPDLACGATATVIYYFSAWCPICLQHLPELMAMYRSELMEAGVTLALVVGRDQLYQPATATACRQVMERYDLDEVSVLYDPTESMLKALDGSSGGGLMMVTDGAGRVVYHARTGGSLDEVRLALDDVLTQECSEGPLQSEL